MRRLIIFCIASLTAAAPQIYTHSLSHESLDGSPRAGQGLQGVQQEQQYSLDTPLIEDTLRALHFPAQHRPFTRYGVHPQHKENEVLVSKKFFIHSAPEEEDDEVPEKVLTVGQHKKNYNVVFIRAPTKSQKPTTVKIIPAIKEEKTVVYVLSKKDSPVDIHARVEEVPTTTTKPEVYFIKYKTPEEATHAQGKIQAEYERLGGSTQIVNEGVSSVSSVIGSIDERSSQREGPSSALTSENISNEEFVDIPLDNSSYLPPNFRH